MHRDRPITTVPPTLPAQAGPTPSPQPAPGITPMQGVAGCLMACLAAVVLGGMAIFCLAMFLPSPGSTSFSDPLCLVGLVLVWPPVAVLLPAVGWLARLPWLTLLMPLIGLGVCIVLWPVSLAFSIGPGDPGLGISLIVAVCTLGPSVWLVVAGVRHLKASIPAV